jgi:hypothetical protein
VAAPGFPSGTYSFGSPSGGPPLISELSLEAMERCGKIGIELTGLIVQSLRRSLNLVLVRWANFGVNLWTVDTFTQYMPQGVYQYPVPPQVVDVLPDSVLLRQYYMGGATPATPSFTTQLNSTTVTVGNLPATPSAGGFISIATMVSVGGIILNGFYQVVSVPGSGEATITAASAATSAVIEGGVVPQFVSTSGSAVITVNFPNHGLLIGQSFQVQQTTNVGGINLLGPYAVTAVTGANQFTITAAYAAGSNATVYENNGDVNLATQATQQGQSQPSPPVDILLYPLSRGDYWAVPQKLQQGRPTSFWLDRQISPVFNIWLVPDASGPYELVYKASQQVQDADIVGGQTLNIPYRFLETFTADLAAQMAIKWAPDRAVALAQYAAQQWEAAATEDREKVSSFLTPDMSGYFH